MKFVETIFTNKWSFIVKYYCFEIKKGKKLVIQTLWNY